MKAEELIKEFKIEGKYSKDNGQEYLFDECPYCGKESKFSLNTETDFAQCWYSRCPSRKISKKGRGGINILQLHKKLRVENEMIKLSTDLESSCIKYVANLKKNKKAMGYCIDERKWSKEIVESERIGLNDMGTHIMFPLIYKKRVLAFKAKPMDKLLSKPYWEPAGKPPVPFGLDSIDAQNKCLLVEGEPDRMSALTFGFKAVVTAGGWSNFEERFVKHFTGLEKIYICGDVADEDNPNDPGQLGAYNEAMLLEINRCYNVVLPLHDINECLQEGMSKEEFKDIVLHADKFSVRGWGSVDDSPTTRAPIPTIPTGFKLLDDKIGGISYGNIIIGAETSMGKTSMARHLAFNFTYAGHIVGFMPFEMGKEYFDRKFIELAGDDFSRVTGNLHVFDHIGIKYNSIDMFLKELEAFVVSTNAKVVFLDDLDYLFQNYIVTNNIYHEEGVFLMRLQDFAVKHKITTFLMALFNKAAQDKRSNKKLGIPRDRDIHGSVKIGGRCSGIWAFQRNKENDPEIETPFDDPNYCRLWVCKHRDEGEAGPVYLSFNKKTHRFESKYI